MMARKMAGGDGPPDAPGSGATERTPDGGQPSVESMLQEFARHGGSGTGRERARPGSYDELWQLSMADPHTGLVNQLLLLDRLAQALLRRGRHGGEVAACRIDLDNLGEICLDLGYTLGTAVLCELARRLTAMLRAEDTIGRVGSSEIAVVVSVSDESAIGPLLRRIQHAVDSVISVDGVDVRLSASLGVAVAGPEESAEDVLARAQRSSRVSRR